MTERQTLLPPDLRRWAFDSATEPPRGGDVHVIDAFHKVSKQATAESQGKPVYIEVPFAYYSDGTSREALWARENYLNFLHHFGNEVVTVVGSPTTASRIFVEDAAALSKALVTAIWLLHEHGRY